jgi:hypothetical protein
LRWPGLMAVVGVDVETDAFLVLYALVPIWSGIC